MLYKSTRDSSLRLTSAEAIIKGISDEGGLFVPESIPQMSLDTIVSLGDKTYPERAAEIFKLFLDDMTDAEIRYCTDNAYSEKNFDHASVTELAELFEGTYVLELWHGPTCAFKDMALQILPYLLTTSMKKLGVDKKVVILVATSGDTGKAALEGFADVEGTSIMVFYPVDGVSAMQKKQMTTQSGKNVSVCAVKGNFDDCQNGVKAIFTDEAIKEKLSAKGRVFSSANSINWGRLAPQIIYYISAYADLVKNGSIKAGDPVNICVPTGNFGNILAAFYAKRMGLPVNKLICASNSNNVLTDFLTTGVYDRNRDFYTTVSPSMDILISSNLERLLYILTDGNDALIREWFGSLASKGRYEVNEDVKKKLSEEFAAGFADDEACKAEIKKVYDKYSYTLDTHTAVAVKVYEDYKTRTGDETRTIIASTASPYKFGTAVLEAITGSAPEDEFEKVDKLFEVSSFPVPASLAALKTKAVRFDKTVDRAEMADFVLETVEKI
ncbi:MAG: threonine synthase [Oscillospiraceae bacterium]|nr:threonine synthase [Oscillospiraceae bacterium]